MIYFRRWSVWSRNHFKAFPIANWLTPSSLQYTHLWQTTHKGVSLWLQKNIPPPERIIPGIFFSGKFSGTLEFGIAPRPSRHNPFSGGLDKCRGKLKSDGTWRAFSEWSTPNALPRTLIAHKSGAEATLSKRSDTKWGKRSSQLRELIANEWHNRLSASRGLRQGCIATVRSTRNTKQSLKAASLT